MNRRLLTAAVLAAFTAAVHTFVGTVEISGPLLGSALPLELRLLLYACWHLVSCALVLSAGALFWSARRSRAEASRSLVIFVSALWISFGLVFLAVAILHPGKGLLLALPQWTLLLPVGLLGLWGSLGEAPRRLAVGR
jgi:hypothetical protein